MGLRAHGTRCNPQTLLFAPSAGTAAGQLSLLPQPVIPSLFLVQFCLKVAYGLLLRKAYVYVNEPAALSLGKRHPSSPGFCKPFFAVHRDTQQQHRVLEI